MIWRKKLYDDLSVRSKDNTRGDSRVGRLDQIEGYRDMMRDSVRKGHYLPLLPRHGIYLCVYEGDGPRFARNFLATWRRIPLRSRRRMLG
jgi:hypothetical protein